MVLLRVGMVSGRRKVIRRPGWSSGRIVGFGFGWPKRSK